MKHKKISTKLTLKKMTIATLNVNELASLKGGDEDQGPTKFDPGNVGHTGELCISSINVPTCAIYCPSLVECL